LIKGCATTALQLLEVNDNSYCEQEDTKQTLVHVTVDYAVVMIIVAFTSNVLILIVIIKQKKYATLSFCLLLVSTVLWMAMNFVNFIIFFTMYIVQAPNRVCIALLLTINSFLQGANFIETEIVITISYTFYLCYKLYSVLSEEAVNKLFWKLVAVAFGAIIILSTSRF